MSKSVIHVGLDVHAQSIAVAIADAGAEGLLNGSLSSDLHSVDKFLAKLRS